MTGKETRQGRDRGLEGWRRGRPYDDIDSIPPAVGRGGEVVYGGGLAGGGLFGETEGGHRLGCLTVCESESAAFSLQTERE